MRHTLQVGMEYNAIHPDRQALILVVQSLYKPFKLP